MTDVATAAVEPGAAGSPAPGAPAAPSQPAAPTNGQGAPWYAGAGYTDDDRVWIEKKGWATLDQAVPTSVLKSYRELERVMGAKANAVILPKGDDPKALSELMTKLGKPVEPKDYALPATLPPDKAQNLNMGLVEQYRTWAHKADLTNQQFGVLLAEHEAAVEAAEIAADDRFNGEVAKTTEKLRQEMGDLFGENVHRGNLALKHFGISQDEGAKLSEAIGVEKATRMLMSVGGFLAQHKAVGLDNGGKPADGFITDKARAAERIKAVNMLAPNATGPDADLKRALLDPGNSRHREVTAQWREWQRLAHSK